MNFGQAISTCFSKYVTFTGRASRPEFWWFFLFQVIVLIVTGMAQLRAKIEQEPAEPRHLLTETGVGYRLAVD